MDMRAGVSDEPVPQLDIAARPTPGVNLVGLLEGESGLGEVARGLGAAVERAGVPLSAISYRRTPARQQAGVGFPLSHAAPYDTNVICLNADHVGRFAADVGSALFRNRYSIGVQHRREMCRASHRAPSEPPWSHRFGGAEQLPAIICRDTTRS